MIIEYKEQEGLLLDFLKMELNNRAKTDKEIQIPSNGYSANDQDDLTEQGRHNKIQMVIAIGAMTPTQVISHLEWLVRKRGHRCPSAKIKWENDIAYVKNDMEITGAVTVKDIYRKEYHRIGE